MKRQTRKHAREASKGTQRRKGRHAERGRSRGGREQREGETERAFLFLWTPAKFTQKETLTLRGNRFRRRHFRQVLP